MSTYLYHAPLSAIPTAGQEAPGYPAANLLSPAIAKPWRSTTLGVQTLTLDLGADKPIGGVLLYGCNAPSATAAFRPEAAWPIIYQDDFADGTLSPWEQLFQGTVGLVSDGAGGYWLQKDGFGQPHGGIAPLGQTLRDFELIYWAQYQAAGDGNYTRIGLASENGDGYGAAINMVGGQLLIDVYSNGSPHWGTSQIGGYPTGLSLSYGQWYTVRLTKTGDQLVNELYDGQITDFGAATPIASQTVTHSVYAGGFTHATVGGGHPYIIDYISVRGTAESTQPVAMETNGRSKAIIDGNGVSARYIDVTFNGTPEDGATYWSLGAAYVFGSKSEVLAPLWGEDIAHQDPTRAITLENGRVVTYRMGVAGATRLGLSYRQKPGEDAGYVWRRAREGLCCLKLATGEANFWPIRAMGGAPQVTLQNPRFTGMQTTFIEVI